MHISAKCSFCQLFGLTVSIIRHEPKLSFDIQLQSLCHIAQNECQTMPSIHCIQKEHGKMPGMWQLNWFKAALSVYRWCCHHVLLLNRLFREQTLHRACIRHAEEHTELTLSGRDPHCETCAAPVRTPQCPVLPTSSIPSPRETEKSWFEAEHIKTSIVLLSNPECTLTVLLYPSQLSRSPLWESVFTMVTSMNTRAARAADAHAWLRKTPSLITQALTHHRQYLFWEPDVPLCSKPVYDTRLQDGWQQWHFWTWSQIILWETWVWLWGSNHI